MKPIVTAALLVKLLAFSSFGAGADVTNEVDVSALCAFGNAATGLTNGWFASHVDSYADGDNFRLAEKGDYLLSPDFGSPIRRLVVKVKSSSQADRRLAFVPWDGLMYDSSRAVFCDFSPNKDTYVSEEFAIPVESSFSKFKIALFGDQSTAWGIRQLAVVTDGSAQGFPALAPVTADEEGVIRLSSCRRSGGIRFLPDFAILAEVTNNTILAGGWFPPLCAHALCDDAAADRLNVNGGTQQAQGHYVWTTGTEGLGTYTAAATARSWQWRFANDTASRLLLDGVTVVFGQWGNNNSLPDTLACSWNVSTSAGHPVRTQPQPVPESDIFVSPYTNNAPNAQLPALVRRDLTAPEILDPGEILTLTFRDTCPAKGRNAALGLAGLRLLAHPSHSTILLLR